MENWSLAGNVLDNICESQLLCFFTAIESPIALEFPIPDSQFNRFGSFKYP
jgi:hypothetical protein